ncbi:septum site-determining protein Ssd [Aeromicrobium phoceense]|uniref:septum site-determining protein Ssd n=1 Tax=Aeromicrobium phoceense TaxID=2754045 RepID=UPI0019D4F7D6|nr:septum site-determining protein Ssd [Aeromicrobium phoceense]
MDIRELAAAPLVVTHDESFAESARRWCAAAGREPETLEAAQDVRRAWRSASAVLVDARSLEALLAVDLPRRDEVVVVAEDPREAWRPALDLGARDVLADHEDAAIVGALVRALDGSGEACAIAVVGACGGVGASTLAAATAGLAARRDLRPVLVDGDPMGGGLDLVTGAEAVDGSRWNDLDGAVGHVGAAELVENLPVHRGLALVSFGRAGRPVHGSAPVISAAMRGFDVVVADVPRHLDDLGRELVSRSVLTVVVVPRRLRGLVAARALVDRLASWSGAVAIVTRPAPSGMPAAAVGKELGLPVLADLGTSRRLAADLEHGLGPMHARTVVGAARRVLDTVGLR